MKAAYDINMASLLASISKRSYSEANIDIGDTQVLITIEDDFIVIAFRGTEMSGVDILTDVYAFFNGDGIHTGFHNAYFKVHDQINAVLAKFPYKDIYVTGHSLGGALATIACAELDNRKNIKACYTFGSPRVGNRDTDNKVACPVYRFVNFNDVVPRLPVLAMGYRHVGDLRYLTKNSRVVRCPSALITEPAFVLNLLSSIKSHSIDEYVRKINEAKQSK